MRILIAGGGVAGLTLAYWLHQDGFTPVVVEKASGPRRGGYGIDFYGSGYDVAERMGLIPRLETQQIPAAFVAYVDGSGRPVATLDMSLMHKIMHGKYMALMHPTLETALYQAVAADVGVRFGCWLTAVQQSSQAVTVTFNDGRRDRFDLLIGADGIHSATRNLVFGPEPDFARYLGYYVACYSLPGAYDVGQAWRNDVEPGRQVGAYCSERPGEIVTFFMWEAPDVGEIPPDRRLSTLRAAFDGMGWITARLLADAPELASIFMDTVTQIKMPTWRSGRVALVGDACQCLTLVSGQGASMAMGGAYLLARALRESNDFSVAFRHYENEMRPEIEARQKHARDFAKSFVPGSELGLQVQKVMMKVLLRDAFAGVLRQQFGGDSVLQRAIRRLPSRQGPVLGYAISGKLHESDYQTFALDVGQLLARYDTVHLLLQLEDGAGIDLKALWADLKFGRQSGREIGRLAIVGDRRWSRWLAQAAQPFDARQVRRFAAADIDSAWAWSNQETGPTKESLP